MAHLDWRLTLMVLAMVPLVAVVNGALKGRVQERQQAWKSQYEGYSSRVQGLLESVRLVRAYGNEAYEQRRVEDVAAGLSLQGVRWMTMVGLYQGLMELLMGLAQALVLVAGGWQVLAGAMSPGDLVAYLGLLGLLFTPVRNIVNSMDQYFMGRSALDSVWAILDHEETEPACLAGEERVVQGRLQVKGLSFAYAGGAQALSEVSFTVEPGQTVALVGRSGGGKSTLASLLIGFYRPQAGEILLDGVPLEAHASASLRRQTAVVPQAGLVLSGTVRENIRYGALDADDAAVWRAARLAQAEEFIRELPQGLDAQVGDLGVRLSGGQRQRIAIARALLRDPRLLILDEATSALDAVSEQAVAKALRNLKQGRTTLVIAHRLSTVVGADLILVLEKGRVAQQGTHAQLMAQGGIYRELAQSQLVQDAA
jgi:ABC-type multidrug transport system fused ATPase/permease subunit